MKRLWLVLVLILAALPARAQHADEHDAHQNFVALFTGFTHEDRRDNAFTLGAEYARVFGEWLTIGALAEQAFGESSVWILAIPFGYELGQWRAVVAPGVRRRLRRGRRRADLRCRVRARILRGEP